MVEQVESAILTRAREALVHREFALVHLYLVSATPLHLNRTLDLIAWNPQPLEDNMQGFGIRQESVCVKEDEDDGFDVRFLVVLALPLGAATWALFNVWRVAFRQAACEQEHDTMSNASQAL
eukprot:6167449-Amphidinium_carterae.1